MDERQIARIIASCKTEKARATCFYALRIAEAIETVMSKKVCDLALYTSPQDYDLRMKAAKELNKMFLDALEKMD